MRAVDGIRGPYRESLRSYLSGKGEEALCRAYEIGREAVAAGATLMDVTFAHAEALSGLLSEPGGPAAGSPEKPGDFLKPAHDFLGEALAPFEMVRRGYRDAVASLKKRADELDALNLDLQREIAERKKAEGDLKSLNESLEEKVRERSAMAEERARELALSNEELRQFAYAASHDLREPLRMVASFLQLLRDRYRSGLDDQANEFINYAVDGAERMNRLINDLLEYHRVGMGERRAEKTGLEDSLREALANLKLALEESGAKVTHDPLPVVSGDPAQMTLLFQNLVGNGVKFRREEAPRIHVSAVRQGGEWLLGVHDNGIGIERQYFDKVFAIFQRLHSRDRYEGTGIGLSTCKKIVERQGGRIWLESTPGKGSTFYFTVPAEEGS